VSTEAPMAPGVRWVLVAAEAKARGFKSALAFKRWCRRMGVEIRPTGKLRWVERAAVDRAIAGALDAPPANQTAPAPVGTPDAAVAAAVAQLQARGRRR